MRLVRRALHPRQPGSAISRWAAGHHFWWNVHESEEGASGGDGLPPGQEMELAARRRLKRELSVPSTTNAADKIRNHVRRHTSGIAEGLMLAQTQALAACGFLPEKDIPLAGTSMEPSDTCQVHVELDRENEGCPPYDGADRSQISEAEGAHHSNGSASSSSSASDEHSCQSLGYLMSPEHLAPPMYQRTGSFHSYSGGSDSRGLNLFTVLRSTSFALLSFVSLNTVPLY